MHPTEISKALNSAISAERKPFYLLPGSAIEGIVEQLVTSFWPADQKERDAATAALSSNAKSILRRYAWLMAEGAVKRNSGEMVSKGLVALAIENGPLDDPRHDVVYIAMLFRGAQKLRLNANTLFAEAAELANNPWLKEWICNFPSRSSESSNLEKAFYVHESFNRDGFCYERGPWTIGRKIWEKLRRLFK